jgi:hypothetical protein
LRTTNTDSAATTPASTMPSSPASTHRRLGSVRGSAAFLLAAVLAATFPHRYPRIVTASAANPDDEPPSAGAALTSRPLPDPVKKVS